MTGMSISAPASVRFRSARLCLIVATLVACLAPDAAAQTCNTDGRSLEYGGTICRALLRGSCITIHKRWTFVGDKILEYPDITESKGLVWQLGKTIDMTTDQYNAYEHTKGVASEAVTLKAERRGDDYVLTRHNQMLSHEETPQSNLWYRVVVRMKSCNSCVLVLYEVSGNTGTQLEQNTLTGNWCRVDQ